MRTPKPRLDDPTPTWRVITDDIKILMREDYARGATAREVALKYGTSIPTVYRHAREGGWTKREMNAARGRVEFAKREAARAVEESAPERTPLEDARFQLSEAKRLLNEALAAGRVAEVKTLAGVIETLEARAAEEEKREAEARKQVDPALRAEAMARWRTEAFRYALELAMAMLFNPHAAPAIFCGLVAEWRWIYLEDGDEASVRAAYQRAEHIHKTAGMTSKHWKVMLENYVHMPRPDWRGEWQLTARLREASDVLLKEAADAVAAEETEAIRRPLLG